MHKVHNRMVSDWIKWFAWYPIKLHGKWFWLGTIYFRTGYSLTDQFGYNEVEYGTIFDMLKEEQNGH